MVGYDSIGNRQALDNDLLNNFVIGDPVATVNGVDYTYDDNGILTPILLKKGNATYDYDYENRLTKVKRVFGNSSTTVSYSYDPFGRRVEREANVDGVIDTTKYLYDGEDIIAEYDGSNNLIREFVHGPGIDEPLAVKTGGNWYYYHADGLGSVINLSDSSGNKVEGYGYDSFGNLVSDGFGGSYTYTGREWDTDAGLYYYRRRFADPETGRFITKDPIGFAGGDVNLYSYVQQNPVNFIDPLGLKPPANIPPNVNISANAYNAGSMSWFPDFYNAVKTGGAWDYKQGGKEFEEFGNYHFGVVAAAAGFTQNAALAGAGYYQLYSDLTDNRFGISGSSITNFDQLMDQYWIRQGYHDYVNGMYDLNSPCEK